MVLSVPLVEASAKVRTGFAVDDEKEYAETNGWTGVIPFIWTAGKPIPDARRKKEIVAPANIQRYSRPQ
jgi:hypothetical protein